VEEYKNNTRRLSTALRLVHFGADYVVYLEINEPSLYRRTATWPRKAASPST
jgi:hypothetical protein